MPSPYQDADSNVETTEVYYYSPSKGEGVFLGKTIKKTNSKGETSYTLIDTTDRVFGPDVSSEDKAQAVWSTIATALERRSEDLGKLRKKDDKEKGKER